MTVTARRPEGIDPSTRLRSLPLAIWPDWSIRLRPPTIPSDTFRTAAAIALCVPGSTCPLRTIREFWPGPRNQQRMVIFGRLIVADPHGNAILAALCALAERLDQDGVPIDYQRRRQLTSNIELLDRRSWRVMCRAGGTPAGGAPKLAHARLWLWETLTGGLPRHAPSALRLATPEFLPDHYRFPLGLPAETVKRLNQHARHLLDTHGCADEPPTWSPSSDGITVDRLPGSDPDAIDPGAVHDAIDDQPTVRHTASELGITVEVLRYIVRKHPRELHDPTAATASARVRFAAQLGPHQLQQLLDQGKSLRQVEASHGIARRTLRDELVAHNLPVPPKNRHRSLQRRQPTDCPSIPDHSNPQGG
jgi:hypothetical protein